MNALVRMTAEIDWKAIEELKISSHDDWVEDSETETWVAHSSSPIPL